MLQTELVKKWVGQKIAGREFVTEKGSSVLTTKIFKPLTSPSGTGEVIRRQHPTRAARPKFTLRGLVDSE